MQEKKPESALPYLLRAQMQQPREVEVLRSLGKSYEGLHREWDAAQTAPQDVNAWLGLGSASLQ